MKKTFLGVILLLPPALHAQLPMMDTMEPQVLSPQVENMMRYDKSKVALYTGRVDLTVPILDWQDPDFDLPFSLSYTVDGFIPTKSENFVGMHWTLDVGGVIMRDVKGIPDEMLELPYRQSGAAGMKYPLYGFLSGGSSHYKPPLVSASSSALLHPTNNPMDNLLENIFFPTVQGDGQTYVRIKGTNREATPDIFNFRFGKYSGKFMMDFDLSIKVVSYSGGKYIVNMDNFIARDVGEYDKNEIKITTDDGYTYYFGGRYSAMEYTALSWNDYHGENESNHAGYESYMRGLSSRYNNIYAFHLNKIIAPNGRVLLILYHDFVHHQFHTNPEKLISGHHNALTSSNAGMNYSISGRREINTDGANHQPSRESSHRSYTVNKIALISQIITDDKTVTFHYSPRSSTIIKADDGSPELFDLPIKYGAKLDSIRLRNHHNQTTEKNKFTYFDNITSGRLHLTKVENSKYGTYNFTYKGSNNLAGPFTMSVDKWGYYCYKPSPANSFFAYVKPNYFDWVTQNFVILPGYEPYREPSGVDYDVSLLSRVTFPTGGSAEYEYEPHDYSAKITQAYPSYNPHHTSIAASEKRLAGGARVRKISYFDHFLTKVKETFFCYSYNPSHNFSSGTLMWEPKCVLPVFREPLGSEGQNLPLVVSPSDRTFTSADYGINVFPSYSPHGFKRSYNEHVCYSFVFEYDVENIISKKDSSYYAGISPLDTETRIKKFTAQVGGIMHEYLDRKGSWTIIGRAAGQNKARLTIIDRNSVGGNKIVKSHTFSGSTETIVLKPFVDIPQGNYRIEISADPGAYISFRSEYPGTGSTKVTGPYKQTVFTDFSTNGDGLNPSLIFHNKDFNEDLPAPLWACVKELEMLFFVDPIDRSHERGKVLKERYFTSSDKLVKEITYHYKRVGNDVAAYPNIYPHIVPGITFCKFTQIVEVPFYSYLPARTVITEYDSLGNAFVVQEEFDYDNFGYLKRTKTIDSDGKAKYKHLSYAHEFTGTPYDSMKMFNIYSPVVSERTEVIYGDSVKPTYNLWRNYSLKDNIGLVHRLPVISSLESSIGEENPEIRGRYLVHDVYGNPLHIVKDDDSHTVFLWGYYGKYVIAKILNATYSDVCNALGNENTPESLSQEGIPDMNVVNSLRFLLPDAHVYTYTYIPLVGMNSSTDPSGRTQYFIYDQAGRISEIYTHNASGQKVVMNKYEYNLVNK